MISIIIPTFNEERNIGELLTFLNSQANLNNSEIIVVDGGSDDHTLQVAEDHGAVICIAPRKSRAAQMNYGAQKAKGEILYFLHADTIPPTGFLNDIKQQVKNGKECGCFRLSFDNNKPVLKLYAWFTRFDLNIFRFGDQSLFVTAPLFDQIGGFNEQLMVMEDQEIIKRLKVHAQFIIINKNVITSARKYQQVGVFKLQLIFSIIVALYYLKVSQKIIIHFYKTIVSDTTY